jgi:hypothetical protein
MRYNTLIFCFCFIFAGCKSDKVQLKEEIKPIPLIQGVWESMSVKYSQFVYINNFQSKNSCYRFDTIYKTNNHIRMEILNSNELKIAYKNGTQTNLSLRFVDMYEENGNYLISTMIIPDSTMLTFFYSTAQNSLSCEFNFSLMEFENCINPENKMLVNFIKQ